MEHDEAQRSMMAERYLLGELAPEQKEQFEEHFFACPECASEVRAGATFANESRTVFSVREQMPVLQKPVTAVGWWPNWLRPAIALPAMSALLAVIAFQNIVTLPKLKSAAQASSAPQILPALSLINVPSRGTSGTTFVVGRDVPFLLYVDIPVQNQFSGYVAEFHNPTGTLAWSVPISSATARDTVPIRVPGLETQGSYSLVVLGLRANGEFAQVAIFPFILQFEK